MPEATNLAGSRSLSDQRTPYLVLYPFVKTIDWYLLGKDTRQGMMNEHIRIGHQYPEIKQLLLYSFGLQDQEFIVVYETEDLLKFSDLVNEMRCDRGPALHRARHPHLHRRLHAPRSRWRPCTRRRKPEEVDENGRAADGLRRPQFAGRAGALPAGRARRAARLRPSCWPKSASATP